MVAGSGGDADAQAAFAGTLVDEWARGGVAHAVVCPGSRSTPLVLALASHPAVRLHVRLDERSAGFTALGIGRATGRPALVVTTSGTAAAELHAAVVEADLAAVPLIACTADRPPELHGVGAAQTIEQTHLFGGSPRWFCDPGVPERAARSWWRSLAARSVTEATTGVRGPGPVHLNLPFREPLIGDPVAAGGVVPGRTGGEPWHRVMVGVAAPDVSIVSSLVEERLVHPDRRGLIVAGAGCGEPAAVLALGAALGWPVLAEPRSGLRVVEPGVIAAADGIVRSARFADAHLPDVVIRLGEGWVSKVVAGFMTTALDAGGRSVVVDPWGRWIDPERQAAIVVRADPTLFCRELATAAGTSVDSGGPGRPSGWLGDWCAAEGAARQVIRESVGEDSPTSVAKGMTEPALACRLFARMPGAGTLVVSSSMPIRDLEAFAAPRASPPSVIANRGANGIDGVVSTALGVALGSAGPTVALVGDLAFLHDATALVRAEGLRAALVVVVADNGGGGIFSFLEQASVLEEESFEMLFGTPQATDVAAVARGFGWTVDDVADGDPSTRFEDVLEQRLGLGALSVIRVRLPGRAENVEVHRRVNGAVAAAVDARCGADQQGWGS
jgi:2-succinyl-5-enolpyruvyl-6-hydroxy-3-cyclohexene-1-carboxylate synthase